jgi:isopenicillin-N N-acyltransferase like protein
MATTSTRVPVLECSGSPRRIGLAHGEAARDLIAQGLDRWRANLDQKRGNASAYIDGFLARTSFLATIEQHLPHLLEEMRGIAEGSGQPFEHILAYNLLDEEWSFRADKLGDIAPGCTAVAIAGTAIGQTMDIPTVHDGTQVVLAIEPEHGPSQRVFTAAGMLGLNGANSAGVGVVVNNLAQLPSSANGLPVICILRHILEHETAAEAAAWAESVPHAVGQHYLIGDPAEIISIEGAANGVYRVPVTERYVHANHPLANPAVSPDAPKMEELSNTHGRAARAEELARSSRDQADLQRILEDQQAPISREPRNGVMTFGGTSIGLASPPTMRVTSGPPHESQWVDVDWA